MCVCVWWGGWVCDVSESVRVCMGVCLYECRSVAMYLCRGVSVCVCVF